MPHFIRHGTPMTSYDMTDDVAIDYLNEDVSELKNDVHVLKEQIKKLEEIVQGNEQMLAVLLQMNCDISAQIEGILAVAINEENVATYEAKVAEVSTKIWELLTEHGMAGANTEAGPTVE